MQYRINAKGKSRNGLSFTSIFKSKYFPDRMFKKEVMEQKYDIIDYILKFAEHMFKTIECQNGSVLQL